MALKNILGLDLGTTSIGFAHVIEGDKSDQSEIIQIGARVNPLTTEEQTNFEKGKPISVNAERTLKRGARRNLDRYQDRRSNLIDALMKGNLISNDAILAEDGKETTFETWHLRAKSVSEKIEKEALARVLLAINKKRGYKSSRKAKNEDERQAIDGMAIAKRLYEENLTPGQLAYQLLKEGKKTLPDFYRSDLQAEFDKVWAVQKQFHPTVFTDEFYKNIQGKGSRATSAAFWGVYGFNTAENKAKTRDDKKLQSYQWRSDAINIHLEKEEAAYVITEINNNLYNSSGYLGAISDRSKELYFNKETVGQHLYKQLLNNPHSRLKNQVFYRQDYLDEFETVWKEQAKYHTVLTDELKTEIRDIVIFYQRKLKSQKGLVSFCEFESTEKEIEKNGHKVKKTIGSKVATKSSPLFQEFKIWQVLGNVVVRKKGSKKRVVKQSNTANLFEETPEVFVFDQESKQNLFNELNLKGNLTANKALELLGYKPTEWEFNYAELEGNRTNQVLFNAYLKILEVEGYDEDLLKLSDKDDINVAELKTSAAAIKSMVKSIFEVLEINTDILEFNAELDGKAFEQQASYQLWHLLYSYEGDDSASGNEQLYALLNKKFGFKKEHSQILANVALSDDYSSLSSKSMRKIIPHIKELQYDKACDMAGYKHSASSLTKEEIANRPLNDTLELLKKNSLRNPVVEKILNQMVNVINTLIIKNSEKDAVGNITKYFKFDEIRIELSRDLKKNAQERAEMTTSINASKVAHEKIHKLLQAEFGIKNPTRNDIIRYRLYEELKNNGFKDLYTNEYIPREILFSKHIDIEHIIPQSKLFDDSFSNKTVVYRKDNLDKGNKTAYDYIDSKYGEGKLEAYKRRIEDLYQAGVKNKEEGISKAKYQKMLKQESEIGDGFIERDLRDSQYIAKMAKNMLYNITRSVVATSGQITNRLREDWGLVNIMQELNFEKFKAIGMIEKVEKKDGSFKERIVDWSKRNDHRHHAMDALTVAFTKRSHIQYLNYLNARKNEQHKEHRVIVNIEALETEVRLADTGSKKRVFKMPITNFRQQAKEHLEAILVSHKAKNKVVTKNKNTIKTKNGELTKIELTPRGQLHDQTIYGWNWWSRFDLNNKITKKELDKIINAEIKEYLMAHIKVKGSIAKAFSEDELKILKFNDKILKEVEVAIPCFTQKMDIQKIFTDNKKTNSAKEKNLKNILDFRVRTILEGRLMLYNNDFKKAFSDLDKNPIWFNEAKGIAIKRVTFSGVKNAEFLHFKKDHLGKEIIDKDGNRIPVDFVSTGNNHHVAIYRDATGKLQDNIISFYEAVQLVNAGEPIIDKLYNQGLGWQFLFSMKQNEYFVFPNEKTGFNPKEVDLLDSKNKKMISPNLFRVQTISIVKYGNNVVRDFKFRHHLETNVDDKKELKDISYKSIKSLGYFENALKVRLNHIGDIVHVGEY